MQTKCSALGHMSGGYVNGCQSVAPDGTGSYLRDACS